MSFEPFSIRRIDDAAQNVAKFVFTKSDAVAEAVLYRYPTYRERTVICCSTQSGCPVGCRFCGAGDYFVRSLAWQEIVAQVDHCIAETDVDAAEIGRLQIMFMSMGEPTPRWAADFFWLTRAGAEMALEPGERLDPEDFPQ